MKSAAVLEKELKDSFTKKLVDFLSENGEDVGYIKDNKFNFPVVDAEGNEKFIVVTVAIPKGERLPKQSGGGFDPYDGYGEREDFEIHKREMAEKAEQRAKAKAAKIKRDEAYRAKLAEQKAKRLRGEEG